MVPKGSASQILKHIMLLTQKVVLGIVIAGRQEIVMNITVNLGCFESLI